MKEPYYFSQNEIESIIYRFGNDFYEKVLRDIDTYSTNWELDSIELIPSYSANLVFTCFSVRFGKAVLKIGNSRSLHTEVNALIQYTNSRFCKVFEADVDRGILLEERVLPGTSLRDESDLEKRLSVFCSLYKGLHVTPVNADLFPTYSNWVRRITDYMSTREDCNDMFVHMQKANEICESLATSYSQQMLLHGDFHHDNILLTANEEYIIIDPKGVIGDPIFDVPRFILNEFEQLEASERLKKIIGIVDYLAKHLQIPNEIIKQCLYVETAMGACWSVEDGATPEEYRRILEDVTLAEAVMNS
ncbi:aminoglycoside phosphotransferase family protein [Paenibacillus qinlingensis]|uniref:Streptomycin 6-kinase n=1 Tax=Paenibacillus qinlingensis TaxID=1837343 RepID=A0ABU1NRV4_9BACL|nr:aminoglycoside phosphotransferase family protein [Paenibacillus qinlingensis]MDR6550190.1 streptomycin 6-kinase [Paenibacillus qinlingensis]